VTPQTTLPPNSPTPCAVVGNGHIDTFILTATSQGSPKPKPRDAAQGGSADHTSGRGTKEEHDILSGHPELANVTSVVSPQQ